MDVRLGQWINSYKENRSNLDMVLNEDARKCNGYKEI